MTVFNILHRSFNPHQHAIVEASAGTGKTFSIENLIARLILEPHPLHGPIAWSQILVVTFTRAATQELRERIYSHLKNLTVFLKTDTVSAHNIPDYLQPHLINEKSRRKAHRLIRDALAYFDDGSIFTIHSFCYHLLQSGSCVEEKTFALPDHLWWKEKGRAFFLDFLANHVSYSPKQLTRAIRTDPQHQLLVELIQTGYPCESFPTIYEEWAQFLNVQQKLLDDLLKYPLFNRDSLLELVTYYRSPKNGMNKESIHQWLNRFIDRMHHVPLPFDAFESAIEEDLVWLEIFDPSLIKKAYDPSWQKQLEAMTSLLDTDYFPMVKRVGDSSVLLLRLATDFRRFLRTDPNVTPYFSYDSLLHEALNHLSKLDQPNEIQERYRAVIVDEFQDTDPLQWKILTELFLNPPDWKGHLYLVGDPKQSIYSFRRADIYTYLVACQKLGPEACYSLQTNYRSHPQLIDGFNYLFSGESDSCFFLPRLGTNLPCPSTHAPPLESSRSLLNDGKKPLHFMIAQPVHPLTPLQLEEEFYLPALVKEIESLLKSNHVVPSDIAILVRDRHQGARIEAALLSQNISSLNQRAMPLSSSPVWCFFQELFEAALFPNDLEKIRVLLSNPLLRWKHAAILQLDKDSDLFRTIRSLHHALIEKGVSDFFALLETAVLSEGSVPCIESLLLLPDGANLKKDFTFLTQFILEHIQKRFIPPLALLSFLKECEGEPDKLPPRNMQTGCDKDQVQILTMHMSKGLEFSIVFALGLLSTTPFQPLWWLDQGSEPPYLRPIGLHPNKWEELADEEEAEKMRQLYVACTRAKDRLYLPLFSLTSIRLGSKGTHPPMAIYLRHKPSFYEQVTASKESLLFSFSECQSALHDSQ